MQQKGPGCVYCPYPDPNAMLESKSKREVNQKLQPMTSSHPWSPVSPGLIALLIPGSQVAI